MKASDWVADFVAAQGTSHVFEVVGGMITHLVDSFTKRGAPKLVSVRHEQGGAFAADAWGRVAGAPGVAMATSGPGAVNLLTGESEDPAHLSRNPMGYVPVLELLDPKIPAPFRFFGRGFLFSTEHLPLAASTRLIALLRPF